MPQLYVNGCSHTAAAEAAVPYCFAEDDPDLPNNWLLGRIPHPANLAVSWCSRLAHCLGMNLICDAESASSNQRILRTTRQFLSNPTASEPPTVMIIQWSTWEREEWYHQGQWYQVNASGTDWVPEELQQRYKQYVIDVDYFENLDFQNYFWNLTSNQMVFAL